MINYNRVTLLCGHYGSGKTNIAVNMALDLKAQYDNVAVADLDIVNPYFRTKDSAQDFKNAGIRLICSDYANSNVDIPALPADMYAITDDKSMKTIIDVGGDDRGAYALGRISAQLIAENDYQMLMVINCYRPLTRDVDSLLEVMREIEWAAKMKFTGIVNNSNLGRLTTADDVIASLEFAHGVSEKTGLPLVLPTVEKSLYDALKDRVPNLFPLTLQAKID